MKPRRMCAAIALVLVATAVGAGTRADPAARRRGLVIGIDGLAGPALDRYAFGAGAGGALRALMEHGVYTRCEHPADERCARTHDGPRHNEEFRWDTASGWAAVVSGMNTAGHGVGGNPFDLQSAFVEASRANPTFFKRLRDRGFRTAAGGVANFLTSARGEDVVPGVLDFECGLEAGALRVEWRATSSCNLDSRRAGDLEDHARDELLAAWLTREIRSGSADVLMGVFDEVDAAGHRFGFEDQGGYQDAIGRVDALVGVVLGSLDERAARGDEEWLVVLTSDHGGHDVVFGLWGMHSTTRIEDEAIPFVVATYGAEHPLQALTSPVRHMDVHPTLLAFFGFGSEQVDGRVQGVSGHVPAKTSTAGPSSSASPSPGQETRRVPPGK